MPISEALPTIPGLREAVDGMRSMARVAIRVGALLALAACSQTPEEAGMDTHAREELSALEVRFGSVCASQDYWARQDRNGPLSDMKEERTPIIEDDGCIDRSLWICGGTMTPINPAALGIPRIKTRVSCLDRD